MNFLTSINVFAGILYTAVGIYIHTIARSKSDLVLDPISVGIMIGMAGILLIINFLRDV